jgi:CBS domain-containing protein
MYAKRVKNLMHRGVISCSEDTPIQEVARLLTEKGIHALVVVDGEGFAKGVISQTDLINIESLEEYWNYWKGLAAKHIMSKEIVSVNPETDLEEARRLMVNKKVHRLIVTEKVGGREKPIGVLSMTDLVRYMAEGE